MAILCLLTLIRDRGAPLDSPDVSKSRSNDKEISGKPNFPVEASLETETPIQTDGTSNLLLSVHNPLPSLVETVIQYRCSQGVEITGTDLNGRIEIPAGETVQGEVKVKVPDESFHWITAEITIPNPSNIPSTLGVTAQLGSLPAGKSGDQGKTVTTKDGKSLSVILLDADSN